MANTPPTRGSGLLESFLAHMRARQANKQIPHQLRTGRILDIGCGSGLSAKVFDCEITGIDPSEELLKQCPFKTIKANAESIPFPDKSFDVVIAVTSMHNFNNIEAGLKEIKRVGKDLFALTVLKKSPKKDSIINLIKKHFKIKKEIDEEKDLIFICS